MYLDHYGLKERPFTLSPDPKYLYYSPSHKEALSQMIYAVTQDSGFMMLTGEVGTGKTILINSLSKNLPDGYLSARVHFTVFDPKELIRNICKEFGIAFTGQTVAELVIKLQEFLKWRYHLGRKSILILDEAQNLSWESLEMIRLLSNVEAMHEKFFQILMVGQPEFKDRLNQNDLRQMRERIGLRCQLDPLNRKETGSYINHRLSVANSRNGRKLFSEEAIDSVYDYSEGIPRRINIMCDNALLVGYTINSRSIDENIIEEVRVDNGNRGPVREKQESCSIPSSVPRASLNKDIPTSEIIDEDEVHDPPLATGNNVLDYGKLQGILEQLLVDNRLVVVKKPKVSTVLFMSLLVFITLTLICFSAVLMAVKLGFMVFE